MSGQSVVTGTILDRIMARTAADLAARKARVSERELERSYRDLPTPVSLASALRAPGIAVIAEIKRASPSRGRFPVEVDPARLAAEYLAGGAAAISCLTDEPFFQGSLADLRAAGEVAHAAASPAPVLRKDFVLDPYQIAEARANGADAILLIVAALTDDALRDLLAAARGLGMDALVEVHDEEELKRAAGVGADPIGINNRDLRTFAVDLAVSERLAGLAPPGATVVAESGILTRSDAARMERAGLDAILVGESLVVAPDRAAAVRDLRGDVVP
jgi:indole-3-glycerol phosphate synthase